MSGRGNVNVHGRRGEEMVVSYDRVRNFHRGNESRENGNESRESGNVNVHDHVRDHDRRGDGDQNKPFLPN